MGNTHINPDEQRGGQQSDALTIVIVSDFAYINSGAANVALSSAIELARRGHSVILFSALSPIDPTLEQHGIRVICLNQRDILDRSNRLKDVIQAIWNRRASVEMSTLLNSLDPSKTVVHLHSWPKAISSSIVPAVLAHGSGLVVTVHDYFLACPNGGFYNWHSEKICHLKPLSLACITTNCARKGYLQKLGQVTRQRIQSSLGHLPGAVRHVITISAFSRGIIEPFLSAGVNLYEIRNPVDVDRRQPVNVSSNESLVFVGHLAAEKGPLLAAQAACISHMKLRFVGDGAMRSQIEANYPDCDISGWLSPGEAKKQMENSRAIVVPSLWYEGSPLVVLDAAARGVPAIVADTCAARESVIDGVTGLWFRGGDAQDLSRKLRNVKDDGLATRLGQNAYDHYWANPQTLATHADELEKCYAKILGSAS